CRCRSSKPRGAAATAPGGAHGKDSSTTGASRRKGTDH
ncbi:MAG: hypothetical protein AVDCRST_MAG49-3666, partial [uncultured Thermomicrobiales bacterium]